MAAAGAPVRWELVQKPGRRGPRGPAARKALGEANGGRGVARLPPLAASETLFALGFEKGAAAAARRQNKEQVPPPPAQPPPPRRPRAARAAKKPPGGEGAARGPAAFRSLDDALKALDLAELQKELDRSQSLFPENPSVWVKDLAGCLNYKLQAPKSDPTLSQHPHDYPYCLVSKELRSTIRSLLSKAGGVLELFFDHCLYAMLQELDRTPGESLHGYRICIQAVLLDKPKIASMALSKYLELLRSHQNRPAKCLTIMWALGQAGSADLTEGLKVWLGVMLPVLGVKSLSPYAVTYLDRLLMLHPNLTRGFGMLGPKDFFPLLDFAFTPNNALPSSLQEQLRQLYPRLKVLAFGAKPETTLHTFFPSFLSRALPSCPPAMKEELLDCLSTCLGLDPLSFSVWRQLYVKHLPQSSLLLNRFLETWDSTPRKVRRSLQETVRSFAVTNEELAAKGPGSAQDVAACRAACKDLMLKARAGSFPWLRLLLVLLVFTAGFLMHDVRTHGSFQASATARALRASGILSASQQAWSRASRFSAEGGSWLRANVPLYCSRLAAALRPTLDLAWTALGEPATGLCRSCLAQLAWLADGALGLVERLRAQLPDAVLHAADALKELLLFLMRNYFLPAVDRAVAALDGVWRLWAAPCKDEETWDCVRRQLVSLTRSSWTFLQDTTVAIKDWALAALSGH